MNWMIDYSLRASIVLGVAFLATQILKRRSAALKHFIWACAFGVTLVTPVFLEFGPRIHIVREAVVQEATPASVASSTAYVVTASPAPIRRNIPYLEIAWILGMLGCAARLWKGHREARRLVRNAVPLSEGIAESDAIAAPLTAGILRPCILLPVEHREWDPGFLKAAIEHELAHVLRRDCLIQWLPNVVCLVQWFNPLVWLARAELLCESERACDDAVVRSGAKGSAFARDLVEVARSICSKGNSSMSVALTTKLERRIARLLDASADRAPLTAARVIPGAIVALGLLAPIAGLRAEQVTKFTTRSPQPLAVATEPVVAEKPVIPEPVIHKAPAARGRRAPQLIAQVQQPTPAPVATPAAADGSATGTFMGVVSDPAGAVVPNATIQVTLLPNEDGGKPVAYSTTSGPVGRWNFAGLPAGRYSIEIMAPGFAIWRSVLAAQPAGFSNAVQARLVLGRTMESVTVSREQSPRDTQRRATLDKLAVSLQSVQPVRVGGNVQAAKLIHRVDPIYPEAAAERGVQGPVTFIAVVDKKGFVRDLIVNNGAPDLAQAGMTAIWQWQYEPTKLNGEPVEVVTEITVNFQLQ